MKKKECPNCAMEIDHRAKNCPICNYAFQQYSRWQQVLALILILIFVLFFVLRF